MKKICIKLFSKENMDNLTDSLGKYFSPKLLMVISFLITITSTVLSMIFLVGIYRDVGNAYAPSVRMFADGNFFEALNPALPWMNILIAGSISYLSKLNPLDSLILTCGLFYMALIPVTYKFLKRFLSPNLAAWGVLLTVCSPKLLRFSISGIPEPSRNFFLVLLLCLVFSFFDKQKIYKAVFIAFAMFGFTLSRSEGFPISLFIIMTIFCFLLWINRQQNWKSKWWESLRYSLLIAFFFLIFLAPCIYQNYLITGYPTPDARLNRHIHKHISPNKPLRDLSDNSKTYTDVKTTIKKRNFNANKQFQQLVNQSLRGAYELYFLLALIGIFSLFLISRIRIHLMRDWTPPQVIEGHKKEWLFIFLVYLFHCGVYFLVPIAYRYFIFLIPLSMPLTMSGVYFLWRLLVTWRCLLPAMLAATVILVLQLLNGYNILIEQNPDYKRSGEWIRDYFNKGKGLKVYNCHSYVIYWIDGTTVNPFYEGPRTKPECADFDIAIVEPDNEKYMSVFRSRQDLVELPTPYPQSVTVFRKRVHE